jgi:hypothetical protein
MSKQTGATKPKRGQVKKKLPSGMRETAKRAIGKRTSPGFIARDTKVPQT